MLGSLKPKPHWEWSAMGKHPVAMDYFQLGNSTPLVQAFAVWIENGYQKVVSNNRNRSTFYSWRFWARGIQKGYIACGLGRDSRDSVGRPYPLVIMGVGKLQDWEGHWDLLTFLFEGIWSQIEHLAVGHFTDLRHLEGEINRIRPPAEEWSAFADQGLNGGTPDQGHGKNADSHIFADIGRAAEALLTGSEVLVSIDPLPDGNASSLIAYWNRVLKSRTRIVPNAVFMGGIPEQSYLALFTRSLNSSDFERLWSVSLE